MTDATRLAEDKALRDAARGLLDHDIVRVKAALAERSIPARAMARATDGAADVLEQVAEAAAQHKGAIAAAVGAVALWLARHPLLAMLDDRDPDETSSTDCEDMTDEQP